MKFVIIFITIICISSCAGRTPTVLSDENMMNTNKEKTSKIMGSVVVFGNEPFTFAGIIDTNDVQYAIYPTSLEDELANLQGYLIEFTVRFVDEQTFSSLILRGGTVTPIEWKILN